MQKQKQFSWGLLAGMALMIIVTLTMGAITVHKDNVDNKLSPVSGNLTVACSADGQTVYVANYQAVFRSRNGGLDWEIVLNDGSRSK